LQLVANGSGFTTWRTWISSSR